MTDLDKRGSAILPYTGSYNYYLLIECQRLFSLSRSLIAKWSFRKQQKEGPRRRRGRQPCGQGHLWWPLLNKAGDSFKYWCFVVRYLSLSSNLSHKKGLKCIHLSCYINNLLIPPLKGGWHDLYLHTIDHWYILDCLLYYCYNCNHGMQDTRTKRQMTYKGHIYEKQARSRKAQEKEPVHKWQGPLFPYQNINNIPLKSPISTSPMGSNIPT